MRLTDYTDYALRVLLFCASSPGRLVTIGEIAQVHGVSKNHLMKVVSQLSRLGVLDAVRGRNGGLQLAKHPDTIRMGDVIRATEPDLRLVECFDADGVGCPLAGRCKVETALRRALDAYFSVLDDLTLEDLRDSEGHALLMQATSVIRVVPSRFSPRRALTKRPDLENQDEGSEPREASSEATTADERRSP